VTSATAFREFHKTFRGAFPDIVVEVEDCIAEGDKVVARCAVRAKHTGDSLGISATNADVDFTGIAICRIRDGRIVEAWNNFDFMRLNRQLGAI
jgi:predicted ester cyclase